jgi:hypothetical protein
MAQNISARVATACRGSRRAEVTKDEEGRVALRKTDGNRLHGPIWIGTLRGCQITIRKPRCLAKAPSVIVLGDLRLRNFDGLTNEPTLSRGVEPDVGNEVRGSGPQYFSAWHTTHILNILLQSEGYVLGFLRIESSELRPADYSRYTALPSVIVAAAYFFAAAGLALGVLSAFRSPSAYWIPARKCSSRGAFQNTSEPCPSEL